MSIREMNRLKRMEAQRDGFDDFCEAHQLPYNDECPECHDIVIKRELQKDYEAITNFSDDWITPLMKKYNLTKEQVLENINL